MLVKIDEPKFSKVYVEWEDSSSHSTGFGGWTPIRDVIETMEEHSTFKCFTIGWLVHEDEKSITVAHTVAPVNNSVNEPMTIPKSAILDRKDFDSEGD
jgi:hypothetical protein